MENLSNEDFTKLLKLSSLWRVSSVNFDGKKIEVEITYASKVGNCPNCGKCHCKLHDKRPSRQWRHLNTMQYPTYIKCSVPRVKCESCCSVLSLPVPWSESHNGYTLMFEDYVIDLLLLGRSIEETRKYLKIDWHTLDRIKEKSVNRGLLKRELEPIKHVGFDEKCIGSGHKYATMLNDLDESRVLDVFEDRTLEATENLIDKVFNAEQCQCVEGVAIDMWTAFQTAAENKFTNAKIVHDKFHVSQHMNKAVGHRHNYFIFDKTICDF